MTEIVVGILYEDYKNKIPIFVDFLTLMPHGQLTRSTDTSFLKTADKFKKFYKRLNKESCWKRSIGRRIFDDNLKIAYQVFHLSCSLIKSIFILHNLLTTYRILKLFPCNK